ncbi:Na+/H+ antiporter NhaC family protein [Evansella sp. AB-rgal1]|uniref:Na+/H+ antiporter NhaC family protein n=1 Tax=Evansella sp. AB-rgal1 TaxID=3242696 RepID=UPI00359DBB7A
MDFGIYSLVPPIVALIMVLITRRVVPSLGVGIIVGAIMLHFSEERFLLEALKYIASIVTEIFYVDGSINNWELYIIFFLLILGIIASFITITGGSRAFGEWALTKVKTRSGAQFVAGFLGIIIFIDDYFNSLTVGNVSRPFTDRHKVSRAKLAYIVDSTAAPMCVISPISSWGAYIIGIIGGIFVTHEVTNYGALQAFLLIVPMNFYALFAILLVFAVAYFKLDFGPMKQHEQRALETGILVDSSKGQAPGEMMGSVAGKGEKGDLIWPIITLIFATIFFMILTGIQATEGKTSLLATFENTDVAAALVYGGLVSLLVTVVIAFKRNVAKTDFTGAIIAGIKSMLPAIFILIFAWTIIEIIEAIGTDMYLAEQVKSSNLNISFLPVILFIVAGFMAFSTGTSWGTFLLMLPLAASIAVVNDAQMLLPALAAVLAGSIFGDHCSPISDTTILSSTGAGSHHIDHVMTQLPYALIVGFISIIGFLVLGFTYSVILALIATFVTFCLVIIVLKKIVTT